jgi:hypothetical protein
VERIRVPEVVFKPSIAGVDQAGLIEIAADIINQRFSSTQDRTRLLKDVFLTGGNTLFQGFEDRFRNELRGVLPVDADLIVRQAADPVMDAWKGAAQWASGGDLSRAFVSRQEYMEKGSEYIKVSYDSMSFSGALLTNPTGARSGQRYMVNVKVNVDSKTPGAYGVESHGLPVLGCFCFVLSQSNSLLVQWWFVLYPRSIAALVNGT